MDKQKIQINNLVDDVKFNAMTKEEKKLEGRLYLNNMLGLIQGIVIASEKNKEYLIRTNINITKDLEPFLSAGIMDELRSKNLMVTVLEVGSGDGLFLK